MKAWLSEYSCIYSKNVVFVVVILLLLLLLLLLYRQYIREHVHTTERELGQKVQKQTEMRTKECHRGRRVSPFLCSPPPPSSSSSTSCSLPCGEQPSSTISAVHVAVLPLLSTNSHQRCRFAWSTSVGRKNPTTTTREQKSTVLIDASNSTRIMKTDGNESMKIAPRVETGTRYGLGISGREIRSCNWFGLI